MWWEFHRLMDLTPDQLVDEDGAIGLLEPVEMLVETKRGARTWRYRYPDQEIDIKGGTLYDPDLQGRPILTPSPARGRSGTVVALDPVGQTIDIKLRAGADHPRAVVPLEPVPDRRASGAAVRARRMGRRARHRRLRAAPSGPRPAARATSAGRAGGRSAARPGRGADARRCASPRPRARPDGARDPGTAWIRQDLHRGPDDLRPARRGQAGRHHGHQPQGHRQPPEGGPQGSGRVRHRPSSPSSERTPRRSSTTRGYARSRPTEIPDGVAEGANLVAGTGWVFANEKIARRGRRAVRRRGRPDLARERRRDVRVDVEHRPARGSRSSSISRSRARTRRARNARPSPTSWATWPRCLPTVACSSRRPGACTPICATTRRRCSTTIASRPEAHLSGPGRRWARIALVGGAGPRVVQLPSIGADNENAG